MKAEKRVEKANQGTAEKKEDKRIGVRKPDICVLAETSGPNYAPTEIETIPSGIVAPPAPSSTGAPLPSRRSLRRTALWLSHR